MAKVKKVDWVAMIDKVWCDNDEDASTTEEKGSPTTEVSRRVTKTNPHSIRTPLQPLPAVSSHSKPQYKSGDSPFSIESQTTLKLQLRKVPLNPQYQPLHSSSDCENPLVTTQPETMGHKEDSNTSECDEVLSGSQHSSANVSRTSTTRQMDILSYIDNVYTQTKTSQMEQDLSFTPLYSHNGCNLKGGARRLFPAEKNDGGVGIDDSSLDDSLFGTETKRKRKVSSSLPLKKKSRTTGTRRNPKKENVEQLYLDAGQRNFGHVTCNVCGMVYTHGQPEDQVEHLQFHKKFLSGVNFPGWKNERVVQLFHDGRIIIVLPSDPKHHMKKVEDIRKIVDIELGYATGAIVKSKYKVFLYISTQRRVMGCVFAEETQQGYKVLTKESSDDSFDSLSAWFCSTTPQPVEVGINRLWVAASHRRNGIGTKLLDAVRSNFAPGHVISRNKIAFSDPTPDDGYRQSA